MRCSVAKENGHCAKDGPVKRHDKNKDQDNEDVDRNPSHHTFEAWDNERGHHTNQLCLANECVGKTHGLFCFLFFVFCFLTGCLALLFIVLCIAPSFCTKFLAKDWWHGKKHGLTLCSHGEDQMIHCVLEQWQLPFHIKSVSEAQFVDGEWDQFCLRSFAGCPPHIVEALVSQELPMPHWLCLCSFWNFARQFVPLIPSFVTWVQVVMPSDWHRPRKMLFVAVSSSLANPWSLTNCWKFNNWDCDLKWCQKWKTKMMQWCCAKKWHDLIAEARLASALRMSFAHCEREVCTLWSVGWLVGRWVGWSVGRSVGRWSAWFSLLSSFGSHAPSDTPSPSASVSG